MGEASAPFRPALFEDAGLERRGGTLLLGGVPVSAIAAGAGTPAYVYNAGVIRRQYRRLAAALAPVPHRICFAVKANSNLAVLRVFRDLGAGADIVNTGAGSDTVNGAVGAGDSVNLAGGADTYAYQAGGRSGTSVDGGGTSQARILAKVSASVAPANSRRRVSDSHSTTPSENTSERRSAGCLSNSSGAR